MKTETTLLIENRLKYYYPTNLSGFKLNKFRGFTTVFEFPVTGGTVTGGLVDCIRLDEYERELGCYNECSFKNRNHPIYQGACKKGFLSPEEVPDICDIGTKCLYFKKIKQLEYKPLITAFEIKISKSDFKSKNGHNFIGHLNYYVMPSELYKDIRGIIPEDIGVITMTNGSLRQAKPSKYIDVPAERQLEIVFEVTKKLRKENDRRF